MEHSAGDGLPYDVMNNRFARDSSLVSIGNNHSRLFFSLPQKRDEDFFG